jgi:hypothetical protein
MTTISKRVKEMSDMPVAKIRATLILEDYTAKDIQEALAEAGLSGKKVAFAESYYGYLSSEERSKAEAIDYIMGRGEFGETSPNVQKHLNHYLGIHALSVAIWSK